jgi:hypothetical protein
MTTPWTFQDAKEHFFIYVERIGASDLLHELRTAPIASHPDVERIASRLYRNLRSTAHAASAPHRTALLGTFQGRGSSIQKLIDTAAADGTIDTLSSAVTLLNTSADSIGQAFEALRTIHQKQLVPEAFQALLRQGTIMAWAAFETFSFDMFRLLFTSDLARLQQVAAAQAKGTPWSDTPKRLLRCIQDQVRADPTLAKEAAFDGFGSLPSMNLRATRHFGQTLFPTDTSLLSSINTTELSKLSARRHLLMHAAGIVDQEYLNNSGEVLPLRSELSVTPRELARGFRAVSVAAKAFAVAAAGIL